MRAPQYPKGLKLEAYGTGMVGDLRELNILNHYIGMPPIEAPALETAIFPYGIAALVLLCLLAPAHRWFWRLATVATAATPLIILIDLQWRLYTFGHTLDPLAPIRLKPFTPLVLGTSKMGNFVSTGMISTGVLCLLAAAVLLVLVGRFSRAIEARPALPHTGRTAVAAMFACLFIGWPAASKVQPSLQARIDAAPPGSTVTIAGGTHAGPVVIRGPLTVIGRNGPVIDGGGMGSVVTLEGDDVVFSGFVIRNSGREVTQEAAGIKATGNRHRIAHNDIPWVPGPFVTGPSVRVPGPGSLGPGAWEGAGFCG